MAQNQLIFDDFFNEGLSGFATYNHFLDPPPWEMGGLELKTIPFSDPEKQVGGLDKHKAVVGPSLFDLLNLKNDPGGVGSSQHPNIAKPTLALCPGDFSFQRIQLVRNWSLLRQRSGFSPYSQREVLGAGICALS